MPPNPSPVLNDELYQIYAKKGTRPEYEKPYRQRTDRLSAFALAESFENRGTYLPAIERELDAILSEKTWVVPSHTHSDLDLASSARAWTVATVDYWLGDRLAPATRARIRTEARLRVIDPYLAAVRGGNGSPRMNWMKGDNNWNAVCHAGTVGTILSLAEDPRERALALAGAEIYLPFFVSGFTDDGYCSEGLGYWSYGFGSYLFLTEAVLQATRGHLDLLAAEKLRAVATYPSRLEISSGVYPTFADGGLGQQAPAWALDYLNRRLQLGRPDWTLPTASDLPISHPLGATLFGAGAMGFLDRSGDAPATDTPPPARPLRDVFSDAGIFILRGATGPVGPFGIAFKGGHNDEHHNHNDLGSYVVGTGRYTPILDPGMEAYTARTFGPKRYDSDLINSYGHNVPMVAGKLQQTGRQAEAFVTEKSFSDTEDRVVLDLIAAYDVNSLTALTRTFTYRRADTGEFIVADRFTFTQPEAFGTALITMGNFRQLAPDRLLVSDRDGLLEVTIDTEGAAFEIKSEILRDKTPGGQQARRIGINLVAPSTAGAITITIRPFARGSGADADSAFPAGFQLGSRAPLRVEAEKFTKESGGHAEVTPKIAATNDSALKFWNDPGHRLEWTFPVTEAGTYAVRLRYCHANPAPSERTATLDTLPLGGTKTVFSFVDTGGWSSTRDDWRTQWLTVNGTILTFPLTAGTHTLALTNVAGSLNTDWLELVSIVPTSSAPSTPPVTSPVVPTL
jgi:hypothetical protein